MKRGWYGESRRHSLARKGIKTSTKRSDIIMKKPYGDYDKDGVINKLDCDPVNPKEQGFFDDLKRGVQKVKSDYKDAREKRDYDKTLKLLEKNAGVRDEIEKKEEALEKKKEDALIRLSSRNAREKAAADLRAKERELDQLQAELEKGSFKEKAKYFTQSNLKRGLLLAQRKARGKKTKLTQKELSATSPKTLKKLDSQARKNANLQAKIALEKLKDEQKILESQLKKLKRGRY